jgi:putative DNA primase/helicase
VKLNEFLSRLKSVSKNSRGWIACCPAHDDQLPSLSVAEGDDNRILLKCHAGCSVSQIVSAMGLELSDLFSSSTDFVELNRSSISQQAERTAQYRSKKKMRQTSFHPYTRQGKLVAGVFRFDPADGSNGKQYVPVHATASGGAVGDPQDEWPLYLQETLSANLDSPVFIVEGEKAADALAGLGLLVTTSAHGSNAWKKTDWSPLVGRHLIVMPDNDEAGGKYVAAVACHIMDLGGWRSLRRIDLTGFPPKADACELLDHLKATGLDKPQLVESVYALAKEWTPNLKQCSPQETLLKDIGLTYGDPVVRGAKGVPLSINQQFAAGWCASTLNILFDPSVQRFYEYDDPTGLWVQQTDAAVVQRVGTALGELLELIGASNLRPKCGQNILSAVTSLLKGMVEKQGVWRKLDNTVHVANGMLQLHTDRSPALSSFSKEFFSRNKSNYSWDTHAVCPRFIGELLSPALSKDDITLLQKYAGQCLLGRNPSQTLLLIRGTAGGGKSTLCEIIEAVIGEKNVAQLRVEQLTSRFESLRFLGRTLLSGKDVSGSFLDSKGAYILKSLVGGDRLEGEVKGGNLSFSLRGELNAIITSNSRLCVRLDGDAAAWRRRLLILDFDQPPVEKRIPFFARTLLDEEGAGILCWMIKGARALLSDLSRFGSIQMSSVQEKRIEDLLAESDSVHAFVRDCIEKADVSSTITVAELTTAYFDYCDLRGWEARSRHRFETSASDVMMELLRVAKRNDIKRDEKNQRGYTHVRLIGAMPLDGGQA